GNGPLPGLRRPGKREPRGKLGVAEGRRGCFRLCRRLDVEGYRYRRFLARAPGGTQPGLEQLPRHAAEASQGPSVPSGTPGESPEGRRRERPLRTAAPRVR